MIVAITQENQKSPKIATCIIWMQCTTFVVLYAVWKLSEVISIPKAALAFKAVKGKCADLTQHTSTKSDSIFGRSV